MPTTASGTPYTTTTIDLGAPHGVMHYTVADAHRSDADIPTVLYAHGAGGASDQMVSLAQWANMRDWLMDNGWCIVEGSGGSVSGAQSWGNLPARAAYPAYLDRASLELSIGVVALVGRSMGGLVTAWLYANDTEGRFSGWINNSGVSTLFAGNTSAPTSNTSPPQIERSTGRYFTAAQWNAWGASDYDGWAAAVTAANAAPELWDPSVWGGKKILALYGDADTTVPASPRGVVPLRARWAGRPAIDQEVIRPGGGHGGTNSSYYDVAPMSAFLLSISGGTPEPPVDPVSYTIIASDMRIGGRRYPMSF